MWGRASVYDVECHTGEVACVAWNLIVGESFPGHLTILCACGWWKPGVFVCARKAHNGRQHRVVGPRSPSRLLLWWDGMLGYGILSDSLLKRKRTNAASPLASHPDHILIRRQMLLVCEAVPANGFQKIGFSMTGNPATPLSAPGRRSGNFRYLQATIGEEIWLWDFAGRQTSA